MEKVREMEREKGRETVGGFYLNSPEQCSQDSYTLHPLVQIGADCRREEDGSPHQDYLRSVAVVVVDCSPNTAGGHLKQRIISQVRWFRTSSQSYYLHNVRGKLSLIPCYK